MKIKLEITGIPSKSLPGDYHTIEYEGGKITCNCIKGKYNEMKKGKIHICTHIETAGQLAIKFLDEIIKLKQ